MNAKNYKYHKHNDKNPLKFLNIFNSSNFISLNKGSSHFFKRKEWETKQKFI